MVRTRHGARKQAPREPRGSREGGSRASREGGREPPGRNPSSLSPAREGLDCRSRQEVPRSSALPSKRDASADFDRPQSVVSHFLDCRKGKGRGEIRPSGRFAARALLSGSSLSTPGREPRAAREGCRLSRRRPEVPPSLDCRSQGAARDREPREPRGSARDREPRAAREGCRLSRRRPEVPPSLDCRSQGAAREGAARAAREGGSRQEGILPRCRPPGRDSIAGAARKSLDLAPCRRRGTYPPISTAHNPL